MNRIAYKIALGVAAVCFMSAIVLWLNVRLEKAGPFLILFFIALAIGFRGFIILRAFSYPGAVFGPLMNITGSVLASYWHRKPVPEKLNHRMKEKVKN